MTSIPQLILTINPISGQLVAELPSGPIRRQIELTDSTAVVTLKRLLEAQAGISAPRARAAPRDSGRQLVYRVPKGVEVYRLKENASGLKPESRARLDASEMGL